MQTEVAERTPGPVTIGPYVLGEELGRGATSVVYRALRDGQAYALKLMTPSGGVDEAEMALRFRREGAAVARLDHPALVSVIEVGQLEGRPYLVMELVEGQSLEDHIAAAPMDEAEVVDLAKVIASALAEVHRHGLVHRDINPGNVVVTPSGGARVIDFGLVGEDSGDDLIVGTLAYAAPEQLGVIKAPVGPASDLYGLGATLFECLAGAPPLVADTPGALLHQLATVPAPDLRTIRPRIRPALAAIVAKLLSKDPDDRYQGAQGLLADLEQLDALDAAAQAGRALELGTRDQPIPVGHQVPLVGRSDEQRRLLRCWSRARAGQISFAQLEGEAGSGKTRLARDLIERASSDGALVLYGKCQEHETVPFGPLREAADAYASAIRRMAEPQRQRQIERVRRAAGELTARVRRMSTGLAEFLDEEQQMRPLEPDAEQQRHYEALATFLQGLGDPGQPLLLLIDDVQWLDEGSLRVLQRVATGALAGHVLVLTSSRDTPSYREALDTYVQAVGPALHDRIVLQPLDRQAIEALIAAHLGGRPLDPSTVDRLTALTHGNPFGVGEYLRVLIEGGIVQPVPGGWRADPDALGRVELPQDVVELVIGRLSSLEPRIRRLVGMASVLGGRFSAHRLQQLAGTSPQRVHQALGEMVRAGLVEHLGDALHGFAHDRVHQAALERLTEQQRRDIHQAIAELIDAQPSLSVADRYALARHYAHGHVERDPARAATANLEAGLAALEEHANEEALELLERALPLAQRAGTLDVLGPRLHEGLGRACAMTGRHDRAFAHLQEAFARAHTDPDRFRLQYLLTLTYASQGRNDEALAALFEAFDVLGRPYPRSLVAQVLSLGLLWLQAMFLRWTGIGHGRAQGPERELRQVLSRLHYAGSMIALFQGNPVLMVQFVVRDLYNVHFLGPTPETAIASSVYGAVLGMFQLRSVMERHTRRGVEMAEQLGDRAALAVCRAYQAMGAKWSGDLPRGNALLLEALPQLHRHVPGSWYAAMMICEQAYSYLHAGRSGAAIEHVRSNAAQLARTNNRMFRYNTVSVQQAELVAVGDVVAASGLWERLEQEFAPLSQTVYVRLARVMARLEVMVIQGETGPEVDAEIAEFLSFGGEDYYSHAARMLCGYARLAQLLAAPPSERPAARRALWRWIIGLSLRAMVPVFRCHPLIWRATLARLDGRHARADALLDRASALIERCDSRRGAFHVALERARLARDAGRPTARFFASEAVDIARSVGWRAPAERVIAEFGLPQPQQPAERDTAATVTLSRSAEQARRHADALLQVSLASTSSLDPEAQAQAALVEVARVLGAERALFFLVDPEDGALQLQASTGPATGSFSETVVQRVLASRTPLVLTGNDDGEFLGSRSIVTHGLRSIIAAPLMLREQLVGVVYLDSRLARGMFDEDDVDLLLGICNHIAIAVQAARMARVEAERTALQRDLELLGAVQILLLPQRSTLQGDAVRGCGFFQPAMQCSGDWWWHETQPDGSVLIVLGDVSGHGAAPAMITGKVAGAFHTMRHLCPGATPPELLAELDRTVRELGGGFHMTLSMIHVDPGSGRLSWWSAAGPPLFLVRDGRCEPIVCPGRRLGDPDGLEVGSRTIELRPTDRLLACTDGLLELRRDNGRELGARSVARLLLQGTADPIDALAARIGDTVTSVLGDRPQDDDITFVVAEIPSHPDVESLR